MDTCLSVPLDGITKLPAGHVGTIKTYLELRQPQQDTLPAPPPGLDLQRLTAADAGRYRAIFRTLGTRWLWWSRLMLDADALAAILDDAKVMAFAVMRAGQDIGLLELDLRVASAPDLAFLGLYEGHTGKGIGNWLMREAIGRSFGPVTEKLTVNTCTFEHPKALGFYRRWGFEPVAQAVELVPDPRRSGLLPRDAAPHVPMVA